MYKLSKRFIPLFLLLSFFVPSTILNASDRPSFNSYDDAISWVRNNHGLSKDSVDTSKSSWIRGAEYYTDGSGYGFLILNMKGKEYIWEDVPTIVWNGFKKADSFGKYYHRNIKGNYYMGLKN